jgi:hypothetical protein
MTPIEVAREGRWAEWHGLDEPSLAALDDPVPDHGAPAVVTLDGAPAVVILDNPPQGDGLAALGEPELVQPARLERFGFETTEHVWPRRGLVLVVAAPYEHAPAEDRTPRIVRAELFAPCSLEAWRTEIAPRSAPRRPNRVRRD